MGEDNFTEMEKTEVENCGRFRINKNLIMLKLSLFFLYGATSSLIPYLAIHMQSIGITMEELGVIYLALPLTTFLAPPITGFLVDKFGQYKPVVIVSFLSAAALHHSLLLIPHQETPGLVPPGYVITHPKKGYVEVWWSPCPSRECPEHEELDIVLHRCQDHCLLKKNIRVQLNATAKDDNNDNIKLHLGKKNGEENSTVAEFTLDMHPNLGDPIEQFGIELDTEEDAMDLKKRFTPKLLRRFGVNVPALDQEDLRCGGIVLGANETAKVRLRNYSSDCILQKCEFISGGPEICPPDYKESDDKIFWLYFVLRFLGTVMMSAGVTMMDPIALAMIEKYGGDFGKERLFSSLGMALFCPITGLFIDMNSERLGYTDYSAAFYTYDILLIISAVAVWLMPLGSKLPADNIFRDLVNIFKMPTIIIFILFLFILGNLWGFIESYLFFYLRDLGAPNYLLGITVTVGTISSIPFLYGADNITKKIGHVNIIIIAFFAYAVRLVGYSMIESAWWCFPFEAMESLSVHLMWVAAATYCALIAPKHLLATLIGVLGMAHFSVGRGSGSFFGGHLISKVGIRQAFKIVGSVGVISGILYAIIHYLWLKRLERNDPESVLEKEIEEEKLRDDETGEPKFKDQSTMVSFERLSLIIKYNQIGSLSSLGKSQWLRSSQNSIRRGSYTIGWAPPRDSLSKISLLKSALDVESRAIQPRPSIKSLGRQVIITPVKSNPDCTCSCGAKKSDSGHLKVAILNEKDEMLYTHSENNVSIGAKDKTTEEKMLP